MIVPSEQVAVRAGRPLRVLHVLEDLGTAGAERQLAAFIPRSDRNQFLYEVCVFSSGGRFVGTLREAGVPIHVLGVATGGGMLRCALRLRRLVREINPDILHAVLFRPGVVTRAVGKWCGRPVVTTLVNTTYEPEWYLDNPRLRRWKVWITHTLDSLTSRLWGTAFVAISESVKASAASQLGIPRQKITVIPRGIDSKGDGAPPAGDVARFRVTLAGAAAYPVILNIGRLVPQKGQQYAIKAMPLVLREFPTARLFIAGEGWLRNSLERLIAAEGLQAHVTLLGERKDVDLLLRAADVFIFPSLYEGFGNALLEAMAVGAPCIVSRIKTLVEVTEGGRVALLVDMRSPEDLAAKIVQLAQDREHARRLGLAAREWVESRYDLREIVAALEALYRDLTAEEHGHNRMAAGS